SRCSRSRSANSRMDSLSIRLSRLICSNSSTFDRAIPDLHADDDTDVKITTRVGPLFATTRCPTTSEVTTQTGPILVKNHDPTGASSDDHTQPPLPEPVLPAPAGMIRFPGRPRTLPDGAPRTRG